MSDSSASTNRGEAAALAMPDTAPKAAGHRAWRYAVLSLIGVAAIGILALRVDVGGIASELKGAEITWVLASAGALTVFYLARAARWHLILGRRHPYPLVFWISSLGYLANNAAPGLGELAKPWLLRNQRSVPFAAGMSTVVLERLLDFWGLATIGLLSFVVLGVQGSAVPGWLVGVGAGVAGAATLALVATFVAARNVDNVMAWIRRVLERLPLSARLGERIHGFLDSLLAGAAVLRSNLRTQAALFGSTWAIWLINALAAYLAFRAVGLEPEAAVLVGGLMAVAVSQGLPAPPGYIGTYQAVWLLAYSGLGLGPEEKVLAAAIVSHGLILVLTVSYGLLGLHAVLISARELLTLKEEPGPAFVPAGLTSEEET
jgi:uncharacterized protein (TIRG00374 family)